jgi:hypothetical protein
MFAQGEWIVRILIIGASEGIGLETRPAKPSMPDMSSYRHKLSRRRSGTASAEGS